MHGSWGDLFAKLLRGEIDVLADVNKLPGREALMGFPDAPMGWENFLLCAFQGSNWYTPGDYACLEGRIFAAPLGSTSAEWFRQWLKEQGIRAHVLEVADIFDRDFLQACSVSGVVTTDASLPQSLVSLVSFKRAPYYLAVQKGRPDLLDALNVAARQLAHDDPRFLARLKLDMEAALDPVQDRIARMRGTWADLPRELCIGYRDNITPFSLSKEGSPEPLGAIREVLRAAKDLAGEGHEFRYLPFADSESLLRALREGKVDVAIPPAV